MIRRSIFIGVFAAVLSGVIFTSVTHAIGRIQPDPNTMDMTDGSPAIHVLRAHSSGSVTSLKLAAYFEGRNGNTIAPANQTLTILDTSRSCRDSGGNGDTIGISISISGTERYKKKGDCTGIFRNFTINSWSDDRTKSGKWKANIDFDLYDIDKPSSYYTEGSSRNRTYYFRAQVSGGGFLSARENGTRSGYGVVGNSANKDVSYTIPFAMPLNQCKQSGGVQRVGMWDPDSGTYGPTTIRLQESIRGANSWSNSSVSADKSSGSVGIDSIGNGRYRITGNSGTSAWLNFTAEGSKEYRFEISNDNSSSNVYSFFWPYDTIYSETTCAYDLNPNLNANGISSVDPGATVPINTLITNTNPVAYSTDQTRRTITKLVYSANPLTSDKARKDYNPNTPCDAYTGVNRVSCDYAWTSGTNELVSLNAWENTRTFTYTAATSEIGKYVCFIASVAPPHDEARRSAAHAWRHSQMECMLVAKHPKTQVLGSDLRVLGNIRASTSVGIGGSPGKTFGSWGEYGVFSAGSNSLAGSGSSYRNGTPDANPSSNLTFANTTTSPKGNYGTNSLPATTTLSDFTNLTSTQALSGDIDLSTLSSGVYDLIGNANISGTINFKSRSIIIRSTEDITINGDILVNDSISYANPSEISQVVIVANKININRGVSRVDSWLLTRSGGLVNTCGEVGPIGDLDKDSCPTPLQVNGAVITDKLYLRRTGGADAETHAIAAEVFNLRASSYMWAYNFVNKQDRAQTTYVKELPPRL